MKKDKLQVLEEIRKIVNGFTPKEPYISNTIERIQIELDGLGVNDDEANQRQD